VIKFRYNGMESVADLSKLTKVTHLDLSYNQIVDVTSLRSFPSINAEVSVAFQQLTVPDKLVQVGMSGDYKFKLDEYITPTGVTMRTDHTSNHIGNTDLLFKGAKKNFMFQRFGSIDGTKFGYSATVAQVFIATYDFTSLTSELVYTPTDTLLSFEIQGDKLAEVQAQSASLNVVLEEFVQMNHVKLKNFSETGELVGEQTLPTPSGIYYGNGNGDACDRFCSLHFKINIGPIQTTGKIVIEVSLESKGKGGTNKRLSAIGQSAVARVTNSMVESTFEYVPVHSQNTLKKINKQENTIPVPPIQTLYSSAIRTAGSLSGSESGTKFDFIFSAMNTEQTAKISPDALTEHVINLFHALDLDYSQKITYQKDGQTIELKPAQYSDLQVDNMLENTYKMETYYCGQSYLCKTIVIAVKRTGNISEYLKVPIKSTEGKDVYLSEAYIGASMYYQSAERRNILQFQQFPVLEPPKLTTEATIEDVRFKVSLQTTKEGLPTDEMVKDGVITTIIGEKFL
ncbi:MAG: hypothetical protein ACRC5Q_07180, partial [Culicoidibacterales bacterium]